MATTAMNLGVPAPGEDSMEMSSPARQDLDEDIDFDVIDYEHDGDATHMNEDDRMMDDGEQGRPNTATDDMMEEDIQQGEQTIVQEEEMQDSPPQVQQEEDEELIDYSDDEIQDEVVQDAGAPATLEQLTESAPVVEIHEEPVDEEITRSTGEEVLQPQAQDTDAQAAPVEENVASLPEGDGVATAEEIVGVDASVEHDADEVQQTSFEPHEQSGQEYVEAGSAAQVEIGDEGQFEAGDEGHFEAGDQQHYDVADEERFQAGAAEAERPTISLDTTAQVPADGSSTPTDTGLHPTIVNFGDFQFPLFKSRKQPDGLLKDDNLASLSLGELIKNCRQRLPTKTGENLPEEQDVVLGFDQLGLVLVEDSGAAFESSLEDVLDVYLQLHRNDGTEDVPPFSLNLTLQIKFTSSISVLKNAAAGGQGMSSFGFVHSGEEEQAGEYYEYADEENQEGQEAYDEQYRQEGNEEREEQQQDGEVEDAIHEQQQADTNDYGGEYDEQRAEDPAVGDYYQDDQEYQEEYGEEQYYDETQDEATKLLDDHTLEEQSQVDQSADAVYNASEDHIEAAHESVQSVNQASVEAEKTASTATSITLQGDDGQDTTGEYNEEDLIDWDDLTSSQSEHANMTGLDESSVLQDNQDGQAIHDTTDIQQQNDLGEGVTNVAGDAAGQHVVESTQHGTQEQILESEDFLGDFEDQGLEADDAQQDNGYDAATNEQHRHIEEHHQADKHAEQQEDFTNADFEAGEDGEQFQTAYELFDEEDTKCEPQHDDANNAVTDSTHVTSTNGEQQAQPQHDPNEDFIDFDFDETAVDDTTATTKPEGSRTPTTKRSFEDLAGDDEIDFESPEPKKQRAS